MKARFVSLAVVLLALLPVSLSAQKVTIDYNKETPFPTFKTYAWKQGTPAKNPFNDERIMQSIEKQLAMKGMLKVDAKSNPDALIAYHAALEYEVQINTFDSGGWYGGWYGGYYGGGTSTTTVDKVPVGMLRVDIGDSKERKLVWQAKATDTVSEKPEKLEKTINKVTEKMFKKFPPEIKTKK